MPSHNKTLYGRHSVNVSAKFTWNNFQELLLFYQLPLSKLLNLIKRYYVSSYK